MKITVPSYYKKFKCIGSKCKHNCCVGWEIDIDINTLEKYKKAEGVFKKRFDDSISHNGECASFILDKDERCPFLNKDNLCDIIMEYGESYLCQICDAHPRFKNFLSDRTEIGIGLCCEEAARIILTDNEDFSLEIEENSDPCGKISRYELEMITYRNLLIDIIKLRKFSLDERVDNVLELAFFQMPTFSLGEWSKKLLELEIMSKEWEKLLIEASKYNVPLTYKGYEKEFEKLFSYFIYRYLANEKYEEKVDYVVIFSVLCSQIIATLWSIFAKNEEERIEICRLFSQEIEYSEENVESIIDIIEEYNEE
ncbi:MAG: flagellin lysine-N-methylase [Clostridia bacterium]|nr:flagellin lysine-N-methylase [Clostridia bacterium]